MKQKILLVSLMATVVATTLGLVACGFGAMYFKLGFIVGLFSVSTFIIGSIYPVEVVHEETYDKESQTHISTVRNR